MIEVKILPLSLDFQLPRQATSGSAGWDVYAITAGSVGWGRRKRIDLGFAVELPEGWCMKIKHRSSMFEKGLIVNDTPIDSDYRGTVFMLVNNTGDRAWHYNKGERIGQLLFEYVPVVRMSIVKELSVTARGDGGIGSTGR